MDQAQHLDAERLAAFMDGSLTRAERAAVEAHAADCAHCLQLLAAMARTEPSRRRASWRLPVVLRWAVPLAAAATALALWVNVDRAALELHRPTAPAASVDAVAPAPPSPAPPPQQPARRSGVVSTAASGLGSRRQRSRETEVLLRVRRARSCAARGSRSGAARAMRVRSREAGSRRSKIAGVYARTSWTAGLPAAAGTPPPAAPPTAAARVAKRTRSARPGAGTSRGDGDLASVRHLTASRGAWRFRSTSCRRTRWCAGV